MDREIVSRQLSAGGPKIYNIPIISIFLKMACQNIKTLGYGVGLMSNLRLGFLNFRQEV